MSNATLLGAVLAALLLAATVRAEDAKPGFHDRVHEDPDGKEAKYVLFVPHDYKGDKEYPLILFLHGAGETGTDGKKQARTGLGSHIRKDEKSFPCFVIFPQAQERGWSAGNANGKRAMAILAGVEKQYKIDTKRVYLTGLSMGGFGTWNFAAKHPDRWAAIVPICGAGRTSDAAKIKDIPCWCFHGADDPTVKVDGSRKMIEALKEAGGKPKYTEYPGVGHNSWDKAYATKELYDWMLKQKLK